VKIEIDDWTVDFVVSGETHTLDVYDANILLDELEKKHGQEYPAWQHPWTNHLLSQGIKVSPKEAYKMAIAVRIAFMAKKNEFERSLLSRFGFLESIPSTSPKENGKSSSKSASGVLTGGSSN